MKGLAFLTLVLNIGVFFYFKMAYRTLVKTNILEASRVTEQEKLHHSCWVCTLFSHLFVRFLLFMRVKNEKISGEFKTWPAVLLFCFTKII